ncbi:MAG: aspartate carbamoyltransferase catalytic subunit [Bacteroidetes bacterium SB0662_bin_6]|nr:aspartate carbamoyltransferase catalytic subunit [Bacteroidetes bacterium SB0668_bin_1]MYE04316.1 aspartate carbamoyltransferase catalytic subunit [Bacteroidetes bacterium SB0662_bin_6]
MHAREEAREDRSAPESLRHRHLLGLSTYDADEIQLILRTAREFRSVLDRPIRRVPTLRDVAVVNLFFEPSTRTRISFELAEKRLSAETVNFSVSGSSVSKGETLKDTARNIEAMKVDMVVIRHRSPGAPVFLTRCVDAVVINAGDGAHEHPTQALLDLLTLTDIHPSLEGRNVSIIGDIAHSRVARSNIYGLRALGAHVTLCAPATMTPVGVEEMGVRVTDRLDEALEGCDVAMALRVQLERQGAMLFPGVREYHERFGITLEHMERHPDLRIMHPGPVNRGVELAGDVVDHERAVILDQVTNGVAVRMAVLYLLAGRGAEPAS